MADKQERKNFFISYTGADLIWAEWIAWQLEQAGYSVMLQAWDFQAGGNFAADMDLATRIAERTIAVLSPDYFHSRFSPSEWQAAFRRDPTSEQGLLLPIRVRDCEVEGLLGAIVYIDLVGLEEAAARERLLVRARRERAKPALAPAFPVTSTPSSEPPAFPGVLPTLWTVPSLRNPFFTGREHPLQQLADAFQSRGLASVRQPQALSGLGGIGKTQIAIEYAYRFSAHYQAVLWARAATREALLADYVAFAELLALPQAQMGEQARVVQAVKQWLATHTGWLLILDNADDLALAREFLPLGSAGHVLLTTRAEVTAPLARRIEIDSLPTEVGADFLLHRSGLLPAEQPLQAASPADQSLAQELCEQLGGLPLALDQAGAYVQENACRLSDYLGWFLERGAELLRQRGDLTEDHPDAVATTWSLSFEQVEQRNAAAAELLRWCAFLHPDSIPEELLAQGTAVFGLPLEALAADPLAMNAALKELRAYSLVRRDPGSQTLSLHRLIQAVLKNDMNEPTRRRWAEQTVRAVHAAFPTEVEHATWGQSERLLPHALTCMRLVEQDHLVFAEAAHLLHQTARYLYQRGRYQEAEPLYLRSLAIREQHLGPQHPDTATSLDSLGKLYYHQEKNEQAESLYQRAFTIREQHLGPQHPDTAKSLHNLAGLYFTLGEYEQAESLYQRALAIREQQLGPEHPDTAKSLQNLAQLYEALGKDEQAELLYLRALVIFEQQRGPNHPDTAGCMDLLAVLYTEKGKYEQAEPLLLRALAIREEQLGLEHSRTAWSLHNLAKLYFAQGKYEQAESLMQRAFTIRERQLGPDHSETADSVKWLAFLAVQQGKYGQAEPLYQRALTSYEQQLGPSDPLVLRLLEQYTAVLEAIRHGTK